MYIVFEGIVGSGKTTQAKKLVEYIKKEKPGLEVVYTREPGGVVISDAIRAICQHADYEEDMNPVTEAYLYAASRAQSLRQVIRPALQRDAWVVADRSFLTSVSNQAFGRELGYERVANINKDALAGILPDLIIYLDVTYELGKSRTSDNVADKFEKYGEEYYKKVTNGYKFLSLREEFKNKWLDVPAHGTKDEVFERILKVLPEIS